MATTKKRINITLPEAEDRAIAFLARRDRVPAATKARELLSAALSLEEDIALDQFVRTRDRKNQGMRVITFAILHRSAVYELMEKQIHRN